MCERPPSSAQPSLNALALKHAHARDACILFDEEPHDYYIDFEQKGTFVKTQIVSITGFIHHFFPAFDAKTMSERVANSRKRKKPEYVGLSASQIRMLWDQRGQEASCLGTRMHNTIERHLNGEQILEPDRCEGYQQWLGFAATRADENWVQKCFRTEMFVFTDPETRLCGAIDALFVNRTDRVTSTLYLDLYDWKRCKEIRTFAFGNAKGFGPCSDLPDTNFYHYSLQLNAYQWILEHYYQNWHYMGFCYQHVRIVNRYIVSCHPNNAGDRALRFIMPKLQFHIEAMIACRRAHLRDGTPMISSKVPSVFVSDDEEEKREANGAVDTEDEDTDSVCSQRSGRERKRTRNIVTQTANSCV
jgi:hypothetical protein